MTALTRKDTPVALADGGVELRFQDIGGDMSVAFVKFPEGTAPGARGKVGVITAYCRGMRKYPSWVN